MTPGLVVKYTGGMTTRVQFTVGVLAAAATLAGTFLAPWMMLRGVCGAGFVGALLYVGLAGEGQ